MISFFTIGARPTALVAAAVLVGGVVLAAQQAGTGPYRVIQRAKVGGEGGWDYLYADAAARRLYIPRGGPARVTVFDLDTLQPVGEIADVSGQGVAVDPKSGHGFVSGKPLSMFDTKTMKVIKTIDVGDARPDGIVLEAATQRVYTFSHPTKNAVAIDAKDGTVLGAIDLGGTPEQGVVDGTGMLYVVMQEAEGSVTAVDTKTMKAVGHYPFGDRGGRCNGLALDAKNGVLFAACGASGTPADRMKPVMVILSAKDGHIITTLPLAGSSDGAVFNPSTMEAFSTHGNGTVTVIKEVTPTTFEVEQNLDTMFGARTVTFDSKTNHVLTMAQEFGAPAGDTPGGRGRGAAVPGSFTLLAIGR